MEPKFLLEDLGNMEMHNVTIEELLRFLSNNSTNGSLFDPYPALPPSLKLFREVIRWMEYVILPTIIIMGLLGNGISFLVFSFSHLRRLSASVYLAALSLANAGFLLIRSIKWTSTFKLLLNTDAGCQTFLYMFHVFRFLSVWYVVSFTVERYIAVCQPFQRQHMCTPRRAKIVVIILAVLSLIIYSFVTWTSGMQKMYGVTECGPKTIYLNMWTFIYGLDIISTLVVPTVAIFILNILITRDVRRLHRNPVRANTTLSYRHIKVLTRRNSDNANCCYKPRRRQTLRSCSGPQAFQGKVTKMLVTVSTTFLLFNLPIHTLTVYHHIQSKIQGPGHPPSHLFFYLQRFFLLIHDSNFAVNFIIYICGRNFRLGLQHLVKRVRYNIYRCRHPYYRNQTPGTTVTGIPPTNRLYIEHPPDNQTNNLQANGMHFRLQRVQSRSTSSSGKSYVSARSRARMLPPTYRRDPPEHSWPQDNKGKHMKVSLYGNEIKEWPVFAGNIHSRSLYENSRVTMWLR